MKKTSTSRTSAVRYPSIMLGGNEVLVIVPIPAQVTITSGVPRQYTVRNGLVYT